MIFKKKDHKCKCSHLKSQHKGWYRPCNECPCSDFMRHDKPNLSTKIGVVFGILWLGFIIFIISALFLVIIDIEQNNLDAFNEPADITMGELLSVLSLIVSAFMIILWLLIGLDSITDYFTEKKRKNWN